jgi:hypothetical protein
MGSRGSRMSRKKHNYTELIELSREVIGTTKSNNSLLSAFLNVWAV